MNSWYNSFELLKSIEDSNDLDKSVIKWLRKFGRGLLSKLGLSSEKEGAKRAIGEVRNKTKLKAVSARIPEWKPGGLETRGTRLDKVVPSDKRIHSSARDIRDPLGMIRTRASGHKEILGPFAKRKGEESMRSRRAHRRDARRAETAHREAIRSLTDRDLQNLLGDSPSKDLLSRLASHPPRKGTSITIPWHLKELRGHASKEIKRRKKTSE